MRRARRLSRREFTALVAAGAATAARPVVAGRRQASLTVEDVIERIRANIGVPWNGETVDTLKAGDPAMRVTGIVTTALPTLAVLRQAAEAGANLVIASQPAFYSRADARTPPAGRGAGPGGRGAGAAPPAPDPIFDAKNAFVDGRQMAIFRLSDHWQARRPDPFAAAFASTCGWTADWRDDIARCAIAPVTLRELATEVKRRLGARGGVRVVGRPDERIASVALLPGSTPIQASVAAMAQADVIVAGEVREWESTEYVRDAVHAGHGKGLVLVGRIVSEEPGMRALADWLAPLVDGVAVRHISAGDPYWRPA